MIRVPWYQPQPDNVSPYTPPVDRHVWSRGYSGPPAPKGEALNALFYAQSLGSMIDDGSGTYTGIAGNPIIWPPAIWHHFAAVYGGLSSGNFTTGASTFGSFDAAITALNAKVTGNWDLSLSIPERITPSQLNARLQNLAPLKIYRSMLDGKFKALVYKQTPDTYDYFLDPFGNNYSWKYSEDMDPKPMADLTDPDAIVNEIHIRYGGFAPDGSLTKDCWVSAEGSDDGSGMADQTDALGGTNDRTARATRSVAFYGIRNATTVDAPEIYTDEIAVKLRNYLFDRLWRRRVTLQFLTGGRASDFYQGMATLVDNELQDHVPIPYIPIDGGSAKRWGDLKFYGNALRQPGLPGRYRMSLVEIT